MIMLVRIVFKQGYDKQLSSPSTRQHEISMLNGLQNNILCVTLRAFGFSQE